MVQVQEVPNEDFEEEGVFFGPILRIKCFEVVQFYRPVTIQLPVSLRDTLELKVGVIKKVHFLLYKNSIDMQANKVSPKAFQRTTVS